MNLFPLPTDSYAYTSFALKLLLAFGAGLAIAALL